MKLDRRETHESKKDTVLPYQENEQISLCVPFLKMTYRRLTTGSFPVKIPRICLQIPQIAREAGYTYLGHYSAQGSILSNPIFLVCSPHPHSTTLSLSP